MLRQAIRAILLCALLLVPSSAADFTVLTDAIQGEVQIAGTGRPAGRVTLTFYNKDVVADDDGRFRWAIPTGFNETAGKDGQPGPHCRVFSHDAREWTWEIVGANSGPNDFARQQAREQLSELARTRWTVRDGKPWLIVECPPFAMVEVAVLGPEGTTVADRPVRVFPAQGRHEFPSGSGLRFTGRTDAEGRIRMRWFEGKRRFRVLVPGVGFGATGMFELLASQTASPEIPRLARFAGVQGTLDPALAGPGTIVQVRHGTWSQGVWDRGEASPDDQGRFTLADLIPGSYSISLTQAGRPVRVQPGFVQLAPGQAVEGLVLRPAEPPRPAGPRPGAPVQAEPGKAHDPKGEFVWAEGTVRNASGRPLPEAVVYARTAYHGGIRMYEEVRKATADALGHYRIQGPVWEFMNAVTVVACSGDRPPAVAYAPAPSVEVAAGRSPLDLALADRGGVLKVTAVRDGKPLPGAWVSLQSDGVAGLTQWARESPLGGELDTRFQPSSRAGADGVARFANLFPGTYRILVNDGPDPLGPHFFQWPQSSGPPLGVAENVGVAADQEVEFSVAIHPQPDTVRFRVIRPDGASVADQNVSISYGLRSPSSSTSLKLDAQGVGTHTFGSPGLWAVDLRFLDSPMKSSPVTEEPYYQAEALLPVSPALALEEPVLLQGIRHDRGSLRVRLLDVAGRPARGTVMIVNGAGADPTGVQSAGTTDARGEVRFPDLPGGEYEVRGVVEGSRPPFDLGPSGRYPEEDDALKGGVAVTDLSAKVEAGAEAFAEFQARPVGYVRGTIHPPAGLKASDYPFAIDTDCPWFPTPWRLDPETGRFTLGPVPAGRHTLKVMRRRDAGPWPTVGIYEVDVPDGVARLDLRPVEPVGGLAPSTSGRSGKVMLGMGGLSQEGAAPFGADGMVRMPGGQAPAFAARALLFAPSQDQPVASSVSDAAGNLTWRGRWIPGGGPARGDGEPAEKPKAVVWLPGLVGAALVEFELAQPIRIVLPGPQAAAGRVTLGGQPIRRPECPGPRSRGTSGPRRARRHPEPGGLGAVQRPLRSARAHARPVSGSGRP